MIIASAMLLTTISSNARQRSPRPGPRRRRNRIAFLRLARLAQRAVDLEHEGVEMDAPLLVDRQRLVEQVHQHRLAAADAAPKVGAADWLGFAEQLETGRAAAQPRARAGACRASCGGQLLGVGPELARVDERPVSLEQSAQICRSTCSFLISAIAWPG
jgi:hypothetical protein